MKNPFKATGKVMSGLWQGAAASDCAPGPSKAAVVLGAPLVVPIVFVAALFEKEAAA